MFAYYGNCSQFPNAENILSVVCTSYLLMELEATTFLKGCVLGDVLGKHFNLHVLFCYGICAAISIRAKDLVPRIVRYSP